MASLAGLARGTARRDGRKGESGLSVEREEVDVQLVLEAEDAGNSRSLFRVTLNGKVIASALTAAQAHLIVGDALEAFVMPNSRRRHEEVTETGGDDR